MNVAKKEMVELKCLKCENSRQVTTAGIQGDGNIYKIKCKCGASYSVAFDRRRFIRKRTQLYGTYSIENSVKDEIANIVDISKGGLCFIGKRYNNLKKDQIITIRFVLDNSDMTPIECKAIIRTVKDQRIGIDFLELSEGIRKTLGFYFL